MTIHSLICKTFDELTGHEVYALAALRQDVFILEQTCLYSDLDGLDQTCLHLLLFNEERTQDKIPQDHALNEKPDDRPDDKIQELIGCLRIIPPNASQALEVSLGRLVVKCDYRRQGLGARLIEAGVKEAIERFPDSTVVLSGQIYLEQFYLSLGFAAVGDPYDEDGIMHRKFVYTA